LLDLGLFIFGEAWTNRVMSSDELGVRVEKSLAVGQKLLSGGAGADTHI